MISRIRKCFLKLFLPASTLMFAISACSTAVDERQTSTGSSLGVVFFGEVRTVYVARTGGAGNTIYQEVPGAFFDRKISREALLDPDTGALLNGNRIADLQFLRVLVSAFGIDLESKIANRTCIYIVRTRDRDITDSVREQILNADNVDDDGDTFIIANEGDGRFSRSSNRRGFEDDGGNFGGERAPVPLQSQHVTLGQTCDRNLGIGQQVVLTMNLEGATIHPMTPEMNLVRDNEFYDASRERFINSLR